MSDITKVAGWFSRYFRSEYLEFRKIPFHRSEHPDLHAFLLLDVLYGGEGAAVLTTINDQMYLFPNPEQIARLNEQEVIELIRCGVLYDEEEKLLYMLI